MFAVQIDNVLVGAIAVVLLAYGLLPRFPRDATGIPAVHTNGWRISLGLLALQVWDRSWSVSIREATALADQGLSSANLWTVAIVLVSAAWVTHLLVASRIGLRHGLAQGGRWIAALLALQIASSAWSEWPALAGFRAVEVVTACVLFLHATPRHGPLELLTRLLWLGIGARVVSHVLLGYGLPLSFGFATMRNNTAAYMAAVLLVLELDSYRNNRVPRGYSALRVCVAALGVMTFGSLATLVAVTLAVLVYVLATSIRIVPVSWVRGALVVGITFCALAAFAPDIEGGQVSLVDEELANQLAPILARDAQSFANITGRLPLWNVAIEQVREQPWGFGFVSGERMLGGASATAVGWASFHVHNGYLSSYLTAGWIGLVLQILVLIQLVRLSPRVRAQAGLVLGLLTLTAVNNFTATVVGSAFHPGWLVLVALTVSSGGAGWNLPRGEGSGAVAVAGSEVRSVASPTAGSVRVRGRVSSP